ncbi:hypothetical protein JZ751_013310 [Albula glossodonta]|uniref:Uncharacterized protein n=1 Tax=Albula glossodonta TaxID=121402 RepID=A0A8T2NSL3_9TELE|nr:hypothetical protein JZ751_013310 [Albula glossodonta]
MQTGESLPPRSARWCRKHEDYDWSSVANRATHVSGSSRVDVPGGALPSPGPCESFFKYLVSVGTSGQDV